MNTWIREDGFALVLCSLILYVCISQGALAPAISYSFAVR